MRKRSSGTSVPSAGRREFLKAMTGLGVAAWPVATTVFARPFAATGATTAVALAPAYDPTARLDVSVTEVELRRNAAGRMLMARIYQPTGAGPFPPLFFLFCCPPPPPLTALL